MNKVISCLCIIVSGLPLNAFPASMMRGSGLRMAVMFGGKPGDSVFKDGLMISLSAKQGVTTNKWVSMEKHWEIDAADPSGIVVTTNAVWFRTSYYCGMVPASLSQAILGGRFSILITVEGLSKGPERTVFAAQAARSGMFALSLKGGGSGRLSFDVEGRSCVNAKIPSAARVFLLSVENGVATIYADGELVQTPSAKLIPQVVLPATMPFAIGGDFAASGLKISTLMFYNKPKTADEAKKIYECVK